MEHNRAPIRQQQSSHDYPPPGDTAKLATWFVTSKFLMKYDIQCVLFGFTPNIVFTIGITYLLRQEFALRYYSELLGSLEQKQQLSNWAYVLARYFFINVVSVLATLGFQQLLAKSLEFLALRYSKAKNLTKNQFLQQQALKCLKNSREANDILKYLKGNITEHPMHYGHTKLQYLVILGTAALIIGSLIFAPDSTEMQLVDSVNNRIDTACYANFIAIQTLILLYTGLYTLRHLLAKPKISSKSQEILNPQKYFVQYLRQHLSQLHAGQAQTLSTQINEDKGVVTLSIPLVQDRDEAELKIRYLNKIYELLCLEFSTLEITLYEDRITLIGFPFKLPSEALARSWRNTLSKDLGQQYKEHNTDRSLAVKARPIQSIQLPHTLPPTQKRSTSSPLKKRTTSGAGAGAGGNRKSLFNQVPTQPPKASDWQWAGAQRQNLATVSDTARDPIMLTGHKYPDNVALWAVPPNENHGWLNLDADALSKFSDTAKAGRVKVWGGGFKPSDNSTFRLKHTGKGNNQQHTQILYQVCATAKIDHKTPCLRIYELSLKQRPHPRHDKGKLESNLIDPQQNFMRSSEY